jgi:hypothetical protein
MPLSIILVPQAFTVDFQGCFPSTTPPFYAVLISTLDEAELSVANIH